MPKTPDVPDPAYVYILKCSDGSYYTGWAYDIIERVRAHEVGKGSKYVRSRLPCVIVYSERCVGKSAAMRREAAIKKMTRKQKQKLIDG